MKDAKRLAGAVKTKLVVLVLSVIIFVALMPMTDMTAYGATATSVNVGSVSLSNGEYTSDGTTKQSGTPSAPGYAYYNNGVLYLNAYNSGHDETIFASSGDLIVNLYGTNTINSTQSHTLYTEKGDLTLQGTGILNISASGRESGAIFSHGGWEDNSGNLYIMGGTINASCDGESSSAIYAYTWGSKSETAGAVIEISGGTINATATGTGSYGIGSENKLIISEGTVTASGVGGAVKNPVVFSDYGPKLITASGSTSGTPVVDYASDNILDYKYLKIEADIDHVHNWSGEWTKDETHHWHICLGCDAINDKAEHTWDDGEITTTPTTTSLGVKTYTCTECGVTKVEDVDMLTSGSTSGQTGGVQPPKDTTAKAPSVSGTNETVPVTGDMNNLGLIVFILLASASSLAMYTKFYKNREK